MARKTRIILSDDLDGSAATSTIGFTLDGVTYEIDLNDKNAQKLRDDFAAWMEHARRVGGRARRGASRGRSDETKRIREWARVNGYEIADRGRVSSEIRAAYAAS
ncbi:histone-like nucleoid-structuring protein Lsr2 [Brachybacterium sp. AOP3-A1-3]|uniref:histone-like nucleoid-structuring protein Lsr2 n=1 Tax=Brachybacterium sp. AOP3-A1-3 TaxID=3457699 RepID=UPI0040345250